MSVLRFVLPVIFILASCTGHVSGLSDAATDGARRDSRAPDDSATPTDAPPSDAAVPDSTVVVDAGPCSTATTLASALVVTAIPESASANRVFGASTPTGGAVAAWNGGDGVHVRALDGAGAPASDMLVIAGDRPYGLAVADDGTIGVIVSRGADALYLVGLDPSGATRFDNLLIGEVDHEVTNNEWFGTGIRDGRLAWTGDRWAAYYTLQRLWDDGIAHYGDQLRLLNLDGSPDRTVWGWGCSHSMEVRIAQSGAQLGPLCASDCFPDKGVFFNHRTMLYTDMRANCAGGYTSHLGGIAPLEGGGFLAAFTAGDGRGSEDVATVRIDGSGAPSEATFLTDIGGDEASPNIAPFGAGAVVGWVAGPTSYLLRVSADGSAVGPTELAPTASLASASDFFSFANGDVGWIIGDGSAVSLARLHHCD